MYVLYIILYHTSNSVLPIEFHWLLFLTVNIPSKIMIFEIPWTTLTIVLGISHEIPLNPSTNSDHFPNGTAFRGLLLLLWLHLLRSAGGQPEQWYAMGYTMYLIHIIYIYEYVISKYSHVWICDIKVYLYTYNISCANKKNTYIICTCTWYIIYLYVCIPHTIQHLHRAFWVFGVHHLDASPFSHPKVDQIGVIWTKSNLLPELFLPPHSSRPTVRTLMKQHKGLSNTWKKTALQTIHQGLQIWFYHSWS